MYLSRGHLASLLVGATATLAGAQQPTIAPSHIDQKALLSQVRSAYYLPLDRGVQGFACNVSFDWSDVLERATGRPIPAKEPTLVALKSATVTVSDDILKGATVKTYFPKGDPPAGSPVASRQKILDRLLTASLNGWNPFLSGRIFPADGTKYRFEPSTSGYRLTLEGGTFFSILDIDPQFRITHGETHLNGTTTSLTPQFDPSTHGWLITSLKTATSQAVATNGTESSSSAQPSDGDTASFGFTYQFVDDILVPKRVTVQYAQGLETPYELKDCTLIKTAIPISAKY